MPQRKKTPDCLLYKTKPCRRFSDDNACPLGLKCVFYHGATDKRTVVQNRKMGLTTDEAVGAHIAQLVAEDNVARARAFAALHESAHVLVTGGPRGQARYAHNPYAGWVVVPTAAAAAAGSSATQPTAVALRWRHNPYAPVEALPALQPAS